MTERRTLHMIWQLSWRSREASHLEEFFVPLSLYRDADLLPEPLKTALEGWEAGRQVTVDIRPGEIIPGFDPKRVFTFARQEFQGGAIQPRFGRYYPRGLLAGHYGNPLPFRCVGVSAQELRADFNHPFASYAFSLTATITGAVKESGGTGGQCLDWFDVATSGPGMQARWQGQPTDFFRDNPFGRRDISIDARFYEEPRLVSHVDAQAQEVLQGLYARLLTPEMEILDLMSSWQSHLPPEPAPKALIGLGLNEKELQANPQLTGYVLHDLNQSPRLPFEAASFDAVICNLSVEYLIRPFEVFADCARVLRPGGLLVHTFSHRWFPPKVIRLWTELTEFERMGLVLEYFLRDGLFQDLQTFSSRNWPRPREDRYFPQARQADPIYAVWGRKTG
ncbi:MAG: methyltransferase domain-containing protein [Syntrophobacterales bacterium]|nr:methyltransferase domain-containing protein [Syntrophobacterales bacterium]